MDQIQFFLRGYPWLAGDSSKAREREKRRDFLVFISKLHPFIVWVSWERWSAIFESTQETTTLSLSSKAFPWFTSETESINMNIMPVEAQPLTHTIWYSFFIIIMGVSPPKQISQSLWVSLSGSSCSNIGDPSEWDMNAGNDLRRRGERSPFPFSSSYIAFNLHSFIEKYVNIMYIVCLCAWDCMYIPKRIKMIFMNI